MTNEPKWGKIEYIFDKEEDDEKKNYYNQQRKWKRRKIYW